MSLEQAINDHAAAIRELAAAFIQVSQGVEPLVDKAQFGAVMSGGETAEERELRNKTTAKALGVKNVMEHAGRPEDEIEQAVQKVEADAKKNAGAADTQTNTAGGTAGSATGAAGSEQAEPLSYEKDVKPVLVKLAGAKGKDALTKLVKSFGVGKATELSADQLPEVLEQANKLLAA